jgi:hypothetical protein
VHCNILSLSLEDGSWYVIFVPSGRTYAPPTSSYSSPIEISTTTIRRLYLDTTKSKETIRTELAKFVPNHVLLAIYLGLNNFWTEMGNRIVRDKAVTEKAKDDLRVGSQSVVKMAVVRRRKSLSHLVDDDGVEMDFTSAKNLLRLL